MLIHPPAWCYPVVNCVPVSKTGHFSSVADPLSIGSISTLATFSLHALLSQDSRTAHEQRTNIATKKPHILSLHGRHSNQVLCVRQMSIQLRQLSVQMCVLSILARGGRVDRSSRRRPRMGSLFCCSVIGRRHDCAVEVASAERCRGNSVLKLGKRLHRCVVSVCTKPCVNESTQSLSTSSDHGASEPDVATRLNEAARFALRKPVTKLKRATSFAKC